MNDVPQVIPDLIEKFDRNSHEYKSPDYNETLIRVEFVNPVFKALGWDVDNDAGYALAYRDVIHEDTLKVGGATKAPDYSFRVGGTRKFFVETKKPAVNLKTDPGPAFQLRRYAYSARLPLSVLTDFEEFVVYDCRRKPSIKDKPSVGRVRYYTFREYAEKWDEISSVFHRESVLRGSFDKYAQGIKGKRGTSEIDRDFLDDLDEWRLLLARNFALRNPRLTGPELNFAVQMTIDRIIFLRMCEARGVEPYGQLQALMNGTQTYPRLVEIYRQADERYNSGLFHFTQEKGDASPPDTLTPELRLDDKVPKGIVRNLYYPDCPYEFSILPVEVLGNAYEQFLGKVIRLTAGHRARVEEKPEVRKAGGVYYTPGYIVDYIVRQTVGKLVEGKTPRQIGKLRILDPACGSGSFLLGAYQCLLDHHRQWYADNDPARHARRRQPPVFRGAHDEWMLTTGEKKRILLNNIHGVDIDRQAVEVTKLSLLLKVLEGENRETLARQLSLWHERALPDLSSNIKCGNSLVGPDYFASQLIPDEDEMRRVNPFDWRAEFPEAMKAGGFDCVIGNPPYIRIQTMKEWAPAEVEIYKQRYAAASKGNYDIYVVFVERALQLLNEHGRMGYILPHKFFQARYGQALRGLLAEGRHLSEIVHFGDQQVFAGATTYTCLLFLDKAGSKQFRHAKAHDLCAWRSDGKALEGKIKASKVSDREWNFVVGPGAPLIERLSAMPVKLQDVTSRIFQGLKTSADKIYIVHEIERKASRIKIYSRQRETEYWLEPDLLHPLIKGGDSKRYSLVRTCRLILFPYAPQGSDRALLIPESTFRTAYPLTWAYLTDNRKHLENRERGKMRGATWFGYTRNQALDVIPLPKIFTPDIAARSSFSLDETGDVFFTGGVAGGYGIIVLPEHSREYVLALLNSRLLEWVLRRSATQMRGGYFSYEARFIRNLPIRTINFDERADVARHDRMVALVERMLGLHEKLAAATLATDKQLYERQIAATDRQIDRLVYELYELTPEEIKIVEEAGR